MIASLVSRLHRVYFNRVGQYLLLLVLTAVVSGTYLWTHRQQSPLGHLYTADIEEIASRSFNGFRLRLSPDRQAVQLTQDGQPISGPNGPSSAPFGLEKTASFRGAIARHAHLADLINADYADRRNSWRALFADAGNVVTAPVVGFFTETQPTLREFRLPRSVFSLWSEKQGPAFESGLLQSLQSAVVFDPATRPGPVASTAISSTTAVAPSEGTAVSPDSTALSFTEKRLSDVTSRLTALEERLSARWPTIELTVLPAGDYTRLQEQVIHRNRELWLSLLGETPPPPAQPSLQSLLDRLNRDFSAELTAVVRTETRPMWVAGRLRWMEVVFWVWFGVLSYSLIDHGLYLVGQRRGEIWQPGELLRTVSKLFYAPALAISLFFLAEFIGASAEAGELGRNSLVTLGIAFILGLFPTSAFRIIRDLSTRLFREDLQGGRDPVPVPAKAVVPIDASHRQAGAETPYTLAQLQQNVARLATAPLAPGSPPASQ